MDLSVFRPLKAHWKKAVTQRKMENLGMIIRKKNFAPVLQDALTNVTPNCIQNGFRAGDLFPFGPDYIDMYKISKIEIETTTKTKPSNYSSTLQATEFLRKLDMVNKQASLKNNNSIRPNPVQRPTAAMSNHQERKNTFNRNQQFSNRAARQATFFYLCPTAGMIIKYRFRSIS